MQLLATHMRYKQSICDIFKQTVAAVVPIFETKKQAGRTYSHCVYPVSAVAVALKKLPRLDVNINQL